MGRYRNLTELERKDLARYTKRLRYNPHTDKDYWEIVKDGEEVVGTASYSMFKEYNQGDSNE